MGRQNSRVALIQQVTAHKAHVQKWCLQIFPGHPALAREVAEHTLVRLLSRLEEGNIAKITTWAYLTTWSIGLQRVAGAPIAHEREKTKPSTEWEATELPWRQGIKIINALDERQRLAIKLKDLRGFSYEAIAQVTGQSPAQVQAQVLDARRNFLIKWDKLRKLGGQGGLSASPRPITETLEKELRIIFPLMRAEIRDCPGETRLMQFLEGTLTPAESDIVNRHTRVCGICDLLLNRVAEFERGEKPIEHPLETPAASISEEYGAATTDMPPRAAMVAAVMGARETPVREIPAAAWPNPAAGRDTRATPAGLPSYAAAGAAGAAGAPRDRAATEPPEKARAALRVFEPEREAFHNTDPEASSPETVPPVAPTGRTRWGTLGLVLILLLAIIGLYITYSGLQK